MQKRVQFLECGVELAAGYLMTHHQGKHILGWGNKERLQPPPPPPPPVGGGPEQSDIFHSGTDAPQLPSGGLSGGSNHMDQPPGSLCEPPHVGIHCDPGGGQPDLPPLP